MTPSSDVISRSDPSGDTCLLPSRNTQYHRPSCRIRSVNALCGAWSQIRRTSSSRGSETSCATTPVETPRNTSRPAADRNSSYMFGFHSWYRDYTDLMISDGTARSTSGNHHRPHVGRDRESRAMSPQHLHLLRNQQDSTKKKLCLIQTSQSLSPGS